MISFTIPMIEGLTFVGPSIFCKKFEKIEKMC